MKIVKFASENVKGIKAIEIVPDEHFQVISGANGQGKSSVLDAIWFALGGKDVQKDTPSVIRDGENSAYVTLDLGDMEVTRRWKDDKQTLEVRGKDGSKYTAPQKLLDEMIGKLSFDPLAFAGLDEAKQKQELMRIVGFDPKTFDDRVKALKQEREPINAEVRRLNALIKGVDAPAEDAPTQEVSVASLMQRLQDAEAVKRLNDEQRQNLTDFGVRYQQKGIELQQAHGTVLELERKLQEARDNVARLEHEAQKMYNDGVDLQYQVNALVDPDINAIRQELANVDVINQRIRTANEYRANVGLLATKVSESEAVTARIAQVEQEKEDLLKAVEFPVVGLGFSETGVTFNGVPLQQCSAAERLKVSTAMAMALNPQLRVIRIADGSLLDKHNLEIIHSMAVHHDYQLWVEVVDESGTVGVCIEDGQVKSVAPSTHIVADLAQAQTMHPTERGFSELSLDDLERYTAEGSGVSLKLQYSGYTKGSAAYGSYVVHGVLVSDAEQRAYLVVWFKGTYFFKQIEYTEK